MDLVRSSVGPSALAVELGWVVRWAWVAESDWVDREHENAKPELHWKRLVRVYFTGVCLSNGTFEINMSDRMFNTDKTD